MNGAEELAKLRILLARCLPIVEEAILMDNSLYRHGLSSEEDLSLDTLARNICKATGCELRKVNPKIVTPEPVPESEELPADDSTAKNMDSIAGMITQATKHGLLVEVVWSFGNERASGSDTVNASNNALYEWDI